jgi:hypothetical protein
MDNLLPEAYLPLYAVATEGSQTVVSPCRTAL